jgi:hypothetical protein
MLGSTGAAPQPDAGRHFVYREGNEGVACLTHWGSAPYVFTQGF